MCTYSIKLSVLLRFTYIAPLTPSGFNITSITFNLSDFTVQFDWDEPIGSGAATVVDNHIITISPTPLNSPGISIVPGLSLVAVLDYNVDYTVSIYAENCAGSSMTFVFPETIRHSKLKSTLCNYFLKY